MKRADRRADGHPTFTIQQRKRALFCMGMTPGLSH